MQRRFVSIWFRHLIPDWLTRRQADLADQPFVIVTMDRGRSLIVACNTKAEEAGVYPGMALADARAFQPKLEAFDYKPNFEEKLLDVIGDWLIRYTPSVSVDLPNGILLDVTGCAHLLGGERAFLRDLVIRLRGFGYNARAAMADTPGAAWAIARYEKDQPLIPPGEQGQFLKSLPPEALRLQPSTVERLQKLGFRTIGKLYELPRPVLNRRFGPELLMRLDQALGDVQELIVSKKPIEPYEERLSFPEGIASPEGIAAVLEKLLESLCLRLEKDQMGIRQVSFTGIRLDGQIESITIGTSQPSRKPKHLFKLFENKIQTIEPALGIEVFILSAGHVDEAKSSQDGILEEPSALDNAAVSELLDNLGNRMGKDRLRRYLPQEHHWPERSIKNSINLTEKASSAWRVGKPRPIRFLRRPEPIEAMSTIPDYPPIQFRYKGKLHRVRKADGPERIEREWWMDTGPPRDYYRVEDEEGHRYWVFRSGHYRPGETAQWFLQGFFA